MPIEFRRDNGRLLWVRNPFTGTVMYFTDIHKKRSGFHRQRPLASGANQAPDWQAAKTARLAELDAARRNCPFCPGNEEMTTEEVLRVSPAQVADAAPTHSPWLIRAFHNLVPRIPEACTGGRSESYVVVEDPRHFADGARHRDELLYSALLPASQLQAVIRAGVEVARRAYDNPAVNAVVLRKNQGYESGASQPHIHNQVIGSDCAFAPVVQEQQRLRAEPSLWREIVKFAENEGFLIDQREGCSLYFCPFGVFPRSYEIVCGEITGRITEVPPRQLDTFAALIHQALQNLGPLPLDYEIHDGPGVPLHAHVNSRHFPYSNIAGTLNLPADIAGGIWRRPAPRG